MIASGGASASVRPGICCSSWFSSSWNPRASTSTGVLSPTMSIGSTESDRTVSPCPAVVRAIKNVAATAARTSEARAGTRTRDQSPARGCEPVGWVPESGTESSASSSSPAVWYRSDGDLARQRMTIAEMAWGTDGLTLLTGSGIRER